jgi:hypothetical protein
VSAHAAQNEPAMRKPVRRWWSSLPTFPKRGSRGNRRIPAKHASTLHYAGLQRARQQRARATATNLGSGVVNHFLRGQVALVAYKHLVDFIAGKGVSEAVAGREGGGGAGGAREAPGITIEHRQPLFHVVERL